MMKRIAIALGAMTVTAPAAWAGGSMAVVVPEMDGGFALAAGAIVIGLGAIVYEKFFRS
jgi:hypothetical protein